MPAADFFFAERVINVWNYLSKFSTLSGFQAIKGSIQGVGLSEFLKSGIAKSICNFVSYKRIVIDANNM